MIIKMKLKINSVDLEFDSESFILTEKDDQLEYSIRKLSEMKDVLLDPSIINDANKDMPLYYMFRSAGMDKNSTVFEAHKIRYDVTVMVNDRLGKEFNKTFGHYHPLAESNLSYPEIYEIFDGDALYILQRKKAEGYDVKLIKASKGDRVLMPPNYAHISVNVGKKPLVEANLVSSKFDSDYNPIKQMAGGAVYVLSNNKIIVNKNYPNVIINYKDKPDSLQFLDNSKSLYDEYIAHPEHFDFLNKPSLLAAYGLIDQ